LKFNTADKQWTHALIIRAFDIVLAMIGLMMAAPLFAAVSILVKLDSKGPVFFPALRIGKDMKPFLMYKFRTMLESAGVIDQSVCPLYDPRVTDAGRFLRRTKLNELPQLLNILKGEMSFVGPRPETPDLVELYPEGAKKIFSVKPGLVGPVVISMLKGTVRGRNEEELYPKEADPKQYYIRHILPEKVKIDLYYLSRQTVGTYLKIIFAAAIETVSGVINARQADHSKRQAYLFIADLALSQLSYGFAYLVYLKLTGIGPSFHVFISGLLLVMIGRSIINYGMGLYSFFMELITPRDVQRAAPAVALGGLLLLGLNAFRGTSFYPPLLALVDFFLLSGLLTGVRLVLLNHYRDRDKRPLADHRPRVAIFGANRNGLKALSALGRSKNSPFRVVGFIDDAEEKYAKKISGVKVLGNRHHIQALSVLHNVREVILAPDDETRDQMDEIVALCARAGIRSRIFCVERENEAFGRMAYRLRGLSLSDMLPQVQVPLDLSVLRSILPGKTVLLFGSGGELGSAICRSIFHSGCRKIVIVDRYKSQISEMLAEILNDFPGFEIVPVVLDSQDVDALNRVFVLHRPQVVIHAGMRKFIPAGQSNDDEVARSNYVRTFNLAKVSARHGCEYFVMISSIRATRGGNFISESLRVAEISLGCVFEPTPTRLIVSRVGNIIENRGGIVSRLNDRILERRPVNLPAETAKAFLLSKNAAARSILQALVAGSKVSPGGLLLTSAPGICLELAEIARRVANFYGLKLGTDITVQFGEIPDSLIYDEPSSMIAPQPEAAGRAPDPLESCGESDRLRHLIENLIAGAPRQLSEREWLRRTEEIVALCGPSLFSQHKALSTN
jgi:FlaA1/EpsC-like NDP-sugar epimerase/lipopolysaccharide/colanic/teichoic acid biosynthesis glycosyltransferase